MASFVDGLKARLPAGGRLCVGLDPSHGQLEAWGLTANLDGLKRFCELSIPAVVGSAEIVKPQVGFFESFGPAGLQILAEVIRELKSAGLLVIADAKRGDIGSTMAGYMQAWLTSEGFDADALTVHSYLGMDMLGDSLRVLADPATRGLFALCATSNPEGAKIQQAEVDGSTVAKHVFDQAEQISANQDVAIGVVIGATQDLATYQLEHIFYRISEVPILAPGYGAQGARLVDLRSQFGESSPMVIPSMSRELLGSDAAIFRDRVLWAREELNWD